MAQKKLGKRLEDRIKEDAQFCKTVKHAAIKMQDYELAADVREIEREYFNKLASDSPEYQQVSKFVDMLKMAGIVREMEMPTAYLIFNIAKLSEEEGIKIDRFEEIKKEALSKF